MKSKLTLSLIVFLMSCVVSFAQSDNDVWRYDPGSKRWFRIEAPNQNDKNKLQEQTRKVEENEVVKSEKQRKQESLDKKKGVPSKKQSRALARHIAKSDSLNTIFAFSTNVLYDCLLAPSLGFEIGISKDWSVGMDGWLAWTRNSKHDFWWQNYGLDIYGRYWFGDDHDARNFKGWHAGVYVGTLTYDVWHDGKGYQCPDLFKTFRTGAELGWSGAIAKDWRVDIYYGLGWFHTDQKVYDHNFGGGYYVTKTRDKDLLDYSRFGITISYIIR